MEVRSVETIVRALNEAKVQYLIVGGLAVIAHGYERLTKDVDLVIALERSNIVRGLRALIGINYSTAIPVSPEQFADPGLRETWRAEKGMAVLKLWSDRHRRTPIDVFVYEPFDFDAEYERAVWHAISAEEKAPILRYAALLKMKREVGRPQDLADVAELEKVRKLQVDEQR